MKNILTVDLEDWFSVEVLSTALPPDSWGEQESVVERNTATILELLARKEVKATFFVLGWIADRYPHLIDDVARAGHEIACHSYYHRMVSSLTADEFRRDTDKAINAIVKACSQIPIGYRSPSWGMRRDMLWAYEILAEFGFQYDSSIFPVKHDIYGDPTAPTSPFEVKVSSGNSIVEIPASTLVVMGRVMPIGGGGWLRQFPYWFTRWGVRKLNAKHIPVMVYFHPWELDRNLPESGFVRTVLGRRGSLKNWLRQYKNIITAQTKIEKLLDTFDFVPIREYISALKERRKEAER